jgi:broad specificity phosphatase PhoE
MALDALHRSAGHATGMQAQRTKHALANFPFKACFSSPISRAKECADILWEGRDTDIILDDNLREADLGWLQGIKNEDAAKSHPEVYGVLQQACCVATVIKMHSTNTLSK